MFPLKTLREFELEREVEHLKRQLYHAGAFEALKTPVSVTPERTILHMADTVQMFMQTSVALRRGDYGWEIRASSNNGKPDTELHFLTMMDREAIHSIPDNHLPYLLAKEYETMIGAMYEFLTNARKST